MRYSLFALLFILAACGPTLESRKEYVRQHDRPPEIERSIINEKIQVGMTKQDVRASWGDPDHVNESYYAGGEPQTQWCYNSSSMQCVYFENGYVDGWN